MAMSTHDLTNYKRRYNEENYERIQLYVTPETKAKWREKASQSGKNLSEFIKDIVNKEIGFKPREE